MYRWAVTWKYAFHPFSMGEFAYREGGIEAAVALGNNHALKGLQPFSRTFFEQFDELFAAVIASTALGVAKEHGAPREIIDLLVAHGAGGGPGDLPK